MNLLKLILKAHRFAGLGLMTCLAAFAQPSNPLDVKAERLRIATERNQYEATFAQAERDCYRRFAVSDCLREARQVRRAGLDDLRRQEIVLNDLECKTSGAQALKRIQQNIASESPASSTQR